MKTSPQPEPNYLTNEEYVERFGRALLSYLNNSIGFGKENHLQDLVAHTGAFADVFFAITEEF